MKEDEVFKYISDHQLDSIMNNTKWKKLVKEINADPNYRPSVNIKYIFDRENNGKFSPVWWEEVERDGYKLIEWIEINPIKEERIGALVPPKVTDHTDFVKSAIEKHGIPYEVNGKVFKIWGYRRTK